jgi:hypothetical protein
LQFHPNNLKVRRWRRIFDLVTHEDFNPSIEAMQEMVNPQRKSSKMPDVGNSGDRPSALSEKARKWKQMHLRDKVTYRTMIIAAAATTVCAVGFFLIMRTK